MSRSSLKRAGQVMQFSSIDDMLGANENAQTDVIEIELEQLIPFRNRPPRILLDNDMVELIESIFEYGLETPILVRKSESEKFEIIAGHRRVHAHKLLKLHSISAIIEELDDVEAVIKRHNSNLHRSEILPSEKAFSYKDYLDARNQQGKRNDLTYSKLENKLNPSKELAKRIGESTATIYRYVALTKLHDELLQFTDEKKLKFGISVEVSYLKFEEQIWILEFVKNELIPSLEQAKQIRGLSEKGKLTKGKIKLILEESKQERKKVSLKYNDIKSYFPENYSVEEIHDQILRLLENWNNNRAK